MKEYVHKHWRVIMVLLAVKFFILSYLVMATAHAYIPDNYTQLFPTLESTGYITDWNYGSNPSGFAGTRIYFLGTTPVLDTNKPVLQNFASSNGGSLNFVKNNIPTVCGIWALCGDMSALATTTGYYAIAYGTGADYSPDYDNNPVYYYIAYISGGTVYSEIPQVNCDNPTTRLLNFTPLDNSLATSSEPVQFTLNACVDEADIGTIKGVNISLHNIDQNVLFIDFLSDNDIWFIDDRDIQTSGLYTFSTSTVLDDGNYRIEACIARSYFWGFFANPFSNITDCQSHQFIVGTSTFIGNISQNAWTETQDYLSGKASTSTLAMAKTCNPLSGDFSVIDCLAFLLVPDGQATKSTLDNLKTTFLTRAPWGYLTRFVSILTSSATTTLPVFTAQVQIGAGDDMTPEITELTFDMGDMIGGGGALLDSIRDPINNKSVRDIFEPIVQLAIALAVMMTIIWDIARMNSEGESRKATKTS